MTYDVIEYLDLADQQKLTNLNTHMRRVHSRSLQTNQTNKKILYTILKNLIENDQSVLAQFVNKRDDRSELARIPADTERKLRVDEIHARLFNDPDIRKELEKLRENLYRDGSDIMKNTNIQIQEEEWSKKVSSKVPDFILDLQLDKAHLKLCINKLKERTYLSKLLVIRYSQQRAKDGLPKDKVVAEGVWLEIMPLLLSDPALKTPLEENRKHQKRFGVKTNTNGGKYVDPLNLILFGDEFEPEFMEKVYKCLWNKIWSADIDWHLVGEDDLNYIWPKVQEETTLPTYSSNPACDEKKAEAKHTHEPFGYDDTKWYDEWENQIRAASHEWEESKKHEASLDHEARLNKLDEELKCWASRIVKELKKQGLEVRKLPKQ